MVGNNVKLAQRLESMAADSILISETTLALVKEKFEVEPAELLSYKTRGKPSVLQTYRVKRVF